MYILLKGLYANFSWMLESKLKIVSAYPTIICFGLVIGFLMFLLYCLTKKWLRAPVISYGLMAAVSLPVNSLITNLPTWDSRVIRVIQNASYILSFKKNRSFLFSTLNIADTETNVKNLPSIIYYLNPEQWTQAAKSAGSSGWYFERVGKALCGVTNFLGCHISIPVVEQSAIALLPGILLLSAAVFFFAKRKRWDGAFFIIFGCLALAGNYGNALFVITEAASFLFWRRWGNSKYARPYKKIFSKSRRGSAPSFFSLFFPY